MIKNPKRIWFHHKQSYSTSCHRVYYVGLYYISIPIITPMYRTSPVPCPCNHFGCHEASFCHKTSQETANSHPLHHDKTQQIACRQTRWDAAWGFGVRGCVSFAVLFFSVFATLTAAIKTANVVRWDCCSLEVRLISHQVSYSLYGLKAQSEKTLKKAPQQYQWSNSRVNKKTSNACSMQLLMRENLS